MLNRNTPPEINAIKKTEVLRVSETTLRNRVPLYHIKAGTQDVIKIELLFPAGMWQQTAPLVGSAASAMLQEGTSRLSARTIAEVVDYYGAFLHTEITHDFASVSIHSLNKHLPYVLPVIQEIITDSVFPAREWEIYLQNKKQAFIVNNKKVNFISRKKFAELLFGNGHPYGHNVTEEDFDRLKREQAFDFYKAAYKAAGTIVVASGNITDKAIALADKHFESIAPATIPLVTPQQSSRQELRNNGPHLIEKKDALQSAIRIGKILFTKSHPDYIPMLVVNTILGGYFGSRLMANIREDKGYTYGIGSAMVSYTHTGYFTISTEVGAEVTRNAIKEIYYEIERLQTEKISEDELSLVRNYMMGTFLRSIDGPFALADRFKGIYFSGLGYDYFDKYIETILTVTPEKIMELANKHLKKEEMVELVVGKK